MNKKVWISLFFVIGLLLLGVRPVWAASPRICSLATMKGSYVTFEHGTILFPTPTEAVIAGVLTYDGAGHFTSIYSANIGGEPVGEPFSNTDTGIYVVYADCTYSDSIASGFSGQGTITGAGMQQQLHFIYSSPDAPSVVIASGTIKKTPQGGCSLASLSGNFGLFGEGTFSPEGSPVLANHVGLATFDGAGHFYGKETVSVGLKPTVQTTFTGTYIVNQNCTVTAEIDPEGMLPLHEAGVITGTGVDQEVHNIVMDSGWSFVETLKKQ